MRYIIHLKEAELLLDYITNLQEKVDQYENPDDMTLMFMWCDEKAKDKIKQLQERIAYLERSNNRREDEIMSLRDECVDGETYKSRNEKAIEYIEHENFKRTLLGFSENKYLKNIQKELSNILNGGDNNE